MVKYAANLREKQILLRNLNQLKEQIVSLEKEKQFILHKLEIERELQTKLSQEKLALTQKKLTLQQNLKAINKRLNKLFIEFGDKQKAFEELDFKFNLLKAENRALIEREKRFRQITEEYEKLKARFNSVAELKKAIKELKIKKSKRVEIMTNNSDTKKIIKGNYGYLIKDGQFTYPAKVRIEVIPATINR
jgi:chromosome segregation ATPase